MLDQPLGHQHGMSALGLQQGGEKQGYRQRLAHRRPPRTGCDTRHHLRQWFMEAAIGSGQAHCSSGTCLVPNVRMPGWRWGQLLE